jgi:hypothetical protein
MLSRTIYRFRRFWFLVSGFSFRKPVGSRSRATGVARVIAGAVAKRALLFPARARARARKGKAPPLSKDSEEECHRSVYAQTSEAAPQTGEAYPAV